MCGYGLVVGELRDRETTMTGGGQLMNIDLSEVLRLHELWLEGDPAGCRAVLPRANLIEVNLAGALMP